MEEIMCKEVNGKKIGSKHKNTMSKSAKRIFYLIAFFALFTFSPPLQTRYGNNTVVQQDKLENLFKFFIANHCWSKPEPECATAIPFFNSIIDYVIKH